MLPGGDGDDRVDEGGHHLGDLRDLLHEDHDRVVDRDDRRDEAGAGDEHADQLGDRLLHDRVGDEADDAADHLSLRSVSFSLISSQAAAGPPCHQRHDDVEGGLEALHDLLAVRAERLDDLAADLRPGDAQHAERELAELGRRSALGM